MGGLKKLRSIIDKLLEIVCAFLFGAMVVICTYQVVTRYFFNSPSTVSEELLTYSFTWMALFASALVFGKRDHMRMGFIADKLTGTKRMILEVIIELLIFAFTCVVLVYGGVSITKLAFAQVTASLGIPMGVVYLVIPISGVIILIYNILNIVDIIQAKGEMPDPKGGIAIRLINLAKVVCGRAPGALAHTNVVANMLFGAISGSGTAAASAMGSIIGPVEEEEGYDRNFSAAANIATAPTGLLIPPSNVMITFSLVSGGTSVAALFMAGYIPGILWGLACMVVIYFLAKKNGYVSKVKFSLKEVVQIILQAIPCLLLIIVVIGGIIGGIFTATEGSAIAVVYSLVLSLFFYKSITWKEIPKILKESAEMTGIIIFLIGVSNIMSWIMAFTGIPTAISTALLGLTDNKFVILFIINILLLFVGTFMDMTPACLIFTPIFLPVCTALGMNTIHFGIMLIFNLCIGTITPPVGTTLFVGVKVGKVKIETVFKQLLWYFAAIIIVLMFVTYIPQLSLWLPGLMGYV